MPQEFSSVPLSTLAVGTVVTAPIFDAGPERTKLLGKDIEITDQFLKQLAARGLTSVSVSKRDLAAICAGSPQGVRRDVPDHQYSPAKLKTDRSTAMDREVLSNVRNMELETSVDRSLEFRRDHYDPESFTAEIQKRERQVAYIDDLFVNLLKGGGTDTDGLSSVCRESIQSVVQDKDLFLCLGINPFDSDYPSRHSLHVSSVAIAIGVILGVDDDSLVDLGTGCLIHDVGMLSLNPKLYKSKRTLSESELGKLSEHPIYTLEALGCPGVRLSCVARIVAYQIHERCNGSGYPHGVTAENLHYLSKIASVADAYVGLVSNRWHRRGMMPYHAIEKLLNSVPDGLFDPKVVRGLLHAVSLFPLGSYVELTDGSAGRVVRTTGESYMQPIVERWDPHEEQFEPDLIDISEDSSVQILRAIPRLPG